MLFTSLFEFGQFGNVWLFAVTTAGLIAALLGAVALTVLTAVCATRTQPLPHWERR
jgi:hypothetical protein